ncbi:hypothetical protein CR152_01750 [Massilia violaceinigra]|uniref:Ice-binding protein C-terminal domain-containing protein n=1 Tax=Massilia violaceinigra TaxID=2045208 RepID=A0A2D2DEG2_9BURK|nr:PEP-CTERM sorting domain-containing protein [Massilia violaceinigra]ATQ73372.1 hypothetical protein CR152_01750 [Massilia violaceinigra]
MPHSIHRLCHVALAASALCAFPAQAQLASASSDITGFSYRLVDLDLADGITPYITITPADQSNVIRRSSSLYGNGAVTHFFTIGDIGTTALSEAFGSSSTHTGSDFMQAQAQYTAVTPGYQTFGGQNEYRFKFSLTPSTRLEFSADIALRANDTGGAIQALSGVTVQGLFVWTPPEVVDYTVFSYTASVEDGTRSDHFLGELRSGAIALDGYFKMTNHATVDANPPPPVPEPQTYAMLFAGLTLLGACARRRQAVSAR